MILYLGLAILLLGIVLNISKRIISKLNKNYPTKQKIKNVEFCILIPARYESKVISDILESIKNQTEKINMKNVYVIIEDLTDPTLKITKSFNANIIMRKKVHLKRKGYALMEAIDYLNERKKFYDAYFIFDADNILDKNYLKNMLKTFKNGYDIGIGYRNTKNGNTNAIASSSSLIFSIINTLGNNRKTKNSMNSTISGTGFYISGKFIKEWKSYPFHSLTEDYELSLYAITHNMTTYYNKDAIYFDEQPEHYKAYKTQRIRWIKGYFEARKLYKKELIENLKLSNPNIGSVYTELLGVWDIILIAFGIILMIIHTFINIITKTIISKFILLILTIYIILILLTIYLLIKEQKRFKLNKKIVLKTIFLHPILLITYIPFAIESLFIKNLEWKTIEHNSGSGN